MIEVLKALSVFFAYAVMAVFAQNAVFTRALGVSRLVKLVDDTTVDSLTFGALLCAVQLISAPLGYFVNLWLAQYPYRMYIRPLVMVLCSTVAFFIVLLLRLLSSRPARRGVFLRPFEDGIFCRFADFPKFRW